MAHFSLSCMLLEHIDYDALQRVKPPPERLTHIRINKRWAVRLLREVSLSAVIYKWSQCREKKKHNKLFTTLRYNIALLASLQLNAYLNPNARTCCVRFLLFILILATDAGTKLLTLVMYMVAETIDQLRITEISVTVTVAMTYYWATQIRLKPWVMN